MEQVVGWGLHLACHGQKLLVTCHINTDLHCARYLFRRENMEYTFVMKKILTLL
jgi:hypothetical protein